MKSCCRRSLPAANPRDFCGSLSMATPVVLHMEQGRLVALVQTPGAQTMPLEVALKQFGCKLGTTTGLMLANLVVKGLSKVTAAGRQNDVTLGRTLPLLTLKEQLFKLAKPCSGCHGAGCATCTQTGFAP